jgi:hypothetical protein
MGSEAERLRLMRNFCKSCLRTSFDAIEQVERYQTELKMLKRDNPKDNFIQIIEYMDDVQASLDKTCTSLEGVRSEIDVLVGR